MHILITGGTGFIGSQLSSFLITQGHEITLLSRRKRTNSQNQSNPRIITNLFKEGPSLPQIDVIINLAGEPLNKKRWTQNVKQTIYHSRIDTTQMLINYIKTLAIKPKCFISGSAIGYYGTSLTQIFNETSPPAHHDFAHKLCNDWEAVANQAIDLGVRVCTIRTGIVLGVKGGALKEMLLPFRCGLGAQLGQGQQWMSWIHEEDVIEAIHYLIQNESLSGPFNLTAPNPVTNKTMTQELAATLHRPTFLRLPEIAVKLIFGEMGELLLLQGQKVSPYRLTQSGFKFKYNTLKEALHHLLT